MDENRKRYALASSRVCQGFKQAVVVIDDAVPGKSTHAVRKIDTKFLEIGIMVEQPVQSGNERFLIMIQNVGVAMVRYDFRIGQPCRQKGKTPEPDGFDDGNAKIFLLGGADNDGTPPQPIDIGRPCGDISVLEDFIAITLTRTDKNLRHCLTVFAQKCKAKIDAPVRHRIKCIEKAFRILVEFPAVIPNDQRWIGKPLFGYWRIISRKAASGVEDTGFGPDGIDNPGGPVLRHHV